MSAFRGRIRAQNDDARDGARSPASEVTIGDYADVGLDGNNDDRDATMDDPTDFRKRLDAARAELLAARVNYISEDSYESTEDAPPIVSKSARAARASGNQCWQEHRKAFVAVIDCSERVLACVDETIERYDSIVRGFNRELEDGKEALEEARTTICVQDTAQNAEKQTRSASTHQAGEPSNRLKTVEKCLHEKEAEIERLEQKSMADEAQHRKELDQLRMAIEEKEAALKLERQSRIKFSLENKRLWRLLHNDEQDLEENADIDCVEKREEMRKAKHQH
ncbi:hypothetical protein AAVH_21491 [Aphelenchoides avenae]|nr:hypothetical protein AAVH_21491 [Aphelenchus avenae]